MGGLWRLLGWVGIVFLAVFTLVDIGLCTITVTRRQRLEPSHPDEVFRLFYENKKSPRWEGSGRLEALPAKKLLLWYEELTTDLGELHCWEIYTGDDI